MPKVSVTIPTHNRAHLLPLALDSVLQQTFSDLEVIVCDDGSADQTPQLMQRMTDPRIRYIRHPQNIGKSNNMRSGFEAAQGEYFMKLDDDDRLTPDFLAKTVAVLEQNPEVDFVGTDHWIIDIHNVRDPIATEQNSQRWGRTALAAGVVQNLLEVAFIHQSFQIGASLFRKAALQEMGYMRPHLQNCEDNDLLVRLAIAGKQAYYLPERLMEYRVHAEQQGLERAVQYLQDHVRYLENFQFAAQSLENIRQSRLAQAKLVLGLRLIEQGDTRVGRQLVAEGRSASPSKAWVGGALSYLPIQMRQRTFALLRSAQA